jgi:dihydroneopterin aldolase
MIEIQISALEVFGYHGVEEAERRTGQTFLFDLWLEVGDAALSDRIDDAVDYRLVVQAVRDVSGSQVFHLLETLAAAVADAVVAGFAVESVRVRVRKPAVALPVEHTAVTVTRP